jgi:outer membrane protein OmpA-like peptidoglycan-associated protein
VAVALSLLAGSAPARAQSAGFALNRFQPADDPAGFFAVSSPDVSGDHRFSAALVSDYANAPLVLRAADGDPRAEVVSSQVHLHAVLGYALFDRLLLSLALPFAAHNAGQDVTPADGPRIAAPRGAALGDLSLGGRARVLGESHALFTLGLGGRIWLPSGQRAAYTSDGNPRASLQLAAGGQSSIGLVWSVAGDLALRRRQELAGAILGDEVQLVAAVGWRLANERLLLGPELVAGFLPGAHAAGRGDLPAQLLLSARYHPGPLCVGLSAGPGLGRAPGIPSLRLLASLGWSPRTAAPIAAPAATIARPAPPPLPPAAPRLADRDGDGIPDVEDRCPREQGARSDDPASHGCPSLVRVTDRQIETLKKVHFVSGIARLHPDASELLGQVAQVLTEHPEIRRIAVEGHTDGRGNARFNGDLSEARARSVQRWLIEHGIAADRLEARGFGATRPLQPDDTEEGRERNRRVEFRILDPAPLDVSVTAPEPAR